MTKDEALTLALEALELPSMKTQSMLEQRDAAITAIKKALAQPEQQVDWEKLYRLEVKKKEALAAKYERDIKPLTKIVPMAQPEQEPDDAIELFEYWNAVEGWVKIDEVRKHFGSVGCGTIYKTAGDDRVPLYTTPPQRPWVGLTNEDKDEIIRVTESDHYHDILMLAEAKLKEKNT